jgi:stage II sporulation protein D
LIAALVAVVLWSCQSTPRAADAVGLPREPDVRIRIRQGVAQIKLSGPDEFVLQPDTGKPATMTGPITAAATPGGCRVTDARGSTREFPGAASIEVLGVGGESADPKLATRIRVDGVTYPGHIRLVPRGPGRELGRANANAASRPVALLASPEQADPRQPLPKGAKPPSTAKLDAVEILPIETYLAGVVGSELYKDWPLTAFEVQAVCARTYALHERARAQKLGRDFDLESTTYDQAYNGGPPLPVALQAVEATRGVVLTWEGHLLRAYYSSTCGGRTASARDVWPTGPGYEFNLDAPIQAKHRETACQSSPRYRWDAVRERAELSRRIREWGKANGNPVARLALLVSVQTAQTNADDRPTAYTLLDDKRATYSLPAEMLRQACNFTVAGLPELTRESKVYSSDMAFEGLGTKITIHGGGFGHGVGMCQYCTKAFADRGRHCRDIVLSFYPGAKLERAY